MTSWTIWRGHCYLSILWLSFLQLFPSLPSQKTSWKESHTFLPLPSTTLSGLLPQSWSLRIDTIYPAQSHNCGTSQLHHRPAGRPILKARLTPTVNTRESVNTHQQRKHFRPWHLNRHKPLTHSSLDSEMGPHFIWDGLCKWIGVGHKNLAKEQFSR